MASWSAEAATGWRERVMRGSPFALVATSLAVAVPGPAITYMWLAIVHHRMWLATLFK
jgi:hypothetical protein